MSDNKKYYYLKLKENYFDSEEIKILESMHNGYKYSLLLLKLYLRSLKFGGALKVNDYIPYDINMISAVTNMDEDTVRVALGVFENLKLIDILDNGTIYLLEIQNYIGKSSTEADRKRIYRNKIDAEKLLLTTGETRQGQKSDISPPEIEIEKEIEKEIELEKEIEIVINTLSSTWTSNGFGMLNKDLLDKLLVDVEIYSLQWVIEAITTGNSRGKRRYDYIKGILNNWQVEGKDDKNGGNSKINKESTGKYKGFKPPTPKASITDEDGII